MIEVVDNGEGIHPADMVMAITRHATSKVADIANLQGISTLGFRGEALAATAAVSRLTLLSSHDDSGIGRQLQVTGVLAETPKLIPVVRTRGTTIIVKDLYFNVPARRGNLKSIATEFAHIETIVREVALVHANVTLNLFHDSKKRLSLAAYSQNGQLNQERHSDSALPLARLEQALGINLTNDALAINIDLSALMLIQPSQISSQLAMDQDAVAHILPPLVPPNSALTTNSASISGWLWPIVDASTTMPNMPKLVYINSRLVKEPIISNQLRQLAQSAELDNMGYALNFELPLGWLNVNVHPSKQRIKISSLNNIMAHLSHAIALKLKDLATDNISKATTSYELDNHLSIDKLSNGYKGALSKTIGSKAAVFDNHSIGKPLSQQVQEKSQVYQHSIMNEPTDNTSVTPINAQALDVLASYQATAATKLAVTDTVDLTTLLAASDISLPKCLEVIDTLDYQAKSQYKNSLSNMPWLLFYYNRQLSLISKQVWQKSLNTVLEVTLPPTNDELSGVNKINHELACYASKMSQYDLIAFSADIERILVNNAIKTLDKSKLLAFMLSDSTNT